MEETIRELIEKLNYYTKLYDEGHPAITDEQWDNMYFKLQQLENSYNIYYKDSPTQSVNYQVVNQLNKVQHNHPMLSLDKTKDINEIYNFIKNKEFMGMAKMDGLTCSLKYLNGKLISAETRGNGIEGEDILHNAFVVKNIPKRIDYLEELIIDGEIICTYKDFENFKDEYKNPRNFASGSIRLLDNNECSKRNLSFIAWDCISEIHFDNYLSEKLDDLKKLNFDTVPYFIGGIDSDLDDLEQQSNFIKKECEELSYPIDGLVFKIDSCKEYAAMGRTDHHFRGGLAYKFYDEAEETILLDIEYTMGRTGKLTPVAILEPVDIDGTEVSRANLHNLSVLKETLHGNGWHGQKVKVAKMNMIIPQIVEAEEDNETTKDYISYVDICPICGASTEIIQDNESEVLYCSNPACEGKLINHIEHFFSKRSGINAKGLSKATIEKLIDWGWVNSILDMFELDAFKKEWINKPGFGEKSVTNILQAIKDSCNCDLESVISAAGIPLIGRAVARDIVKKFPTYKEFREATENDFDFSTIEGFGYEMNKSLKTFNYTELDYIVENYLTINNKVEENKEQKLEGKTFCITGKLTKEHWKNRDELSSFITLLGGKVVSAMSPNVDYLINNDTSSGSAKNLKAKELGKPIIDEQMFIDMFDLQKNF